MYIVFEGIIHSGKTDAVQHLVPWLRERNTDRKVVVTREPGGTQIADDIRTLVQATAYNHEDMEPLCEAYLFAAARAQSLRQVVKPVLASGGIVVADRSFITSLVNQGCARGLGIHRVWQINQHAVGDILPDAILCLNIDIHLALAREADPAHDKFETLGPVFYQKVIRGYRSVSRLPLLKHRWHDIDANGTREHTQSQIRAILEQIM